MTVEKPALGAKVSFFEKIPTGLNIGSTHLHSIAYLFCSWYSHMEHEVPDNLLQLFFGLARNDYFVLASH